MKPNPISLITTCLLFCLIASAQDDTRYQLRLNSGTITPTKNINALRIQELNQQATRSGGKFFTIIQFESIPGMDDRKMLEQAGIEILDYIPGYAYTATVQGNFNFEVLQRVKARSIIELNAAQKMQPELARGEFPSWAVKTPGTIDVWVSYPRSFDAMQVTTELLAKNFILHPHLYNRYGILSLRIASHRLHELASLPFIQYVQAAPHEDQILNNKSTVNSRANVIRSTTGRNLTGEGVVIGVGDDSNPMRHVDFTNRLIHRHIGTGGAHGVHVMGTAGGAGILEEKFTGFAPKSTILAQYLSYVIANSPAYVQDHGMVITNNSYGNIVDDCENFGYYDFYSQVADRQMNDMTSLVHVFAAGNSGYFDCGVYTPGYGTVLSSYQSAKNVVTVGATSEHDSLTWWSSKGPVQDGRIKPEITAQGKAVVSSWPTNIISPNNGTSMAAPAVSGGLALLYQQYRQLHGNANPKSGLMKALLINGATDLGNPGPDYNYGFGWMNLLRSAIMLENNNYFTGNITNAATATHNITVPANTALLKVMLYWNDPAASVLSNKSLVNDLDLEVIDPTNGTRLPFILDPTPANIHNPATTGVDRVNNVEQVVIQNPAAGNYTVRVRGTAITQNPSQEYFLVYDTIPVSTVLTYPIGGERLKGGDSIYVSWDSWGGPANSFHLEYSNNNGGSWTTINNNIAANLRQYKWFLPVTNSDTTDQARIRITRNSSSIGNTSNPFTIIGVPVISLATVQCQGYIAVKWTRVAKCTDYEVMMLRGDEMVPIGTTTDSNYVISGLAKDSVYWVTVRARLNGNPGKRAFAISRIPADGTCAGTISDNDLKLDSIISPASSGRLFTSKILSATTAITVRIRNLDNAVSTDNINLSYTINGGAPISTTLSGAAASIPANGFINYTFSTTADLSALGVYQLEVTATKASDPVTNNNSLKKTVRQLDNVAINPVDLPWLDNFESMPVQSVTGKQMGLNGRDRYDFISSTPYGQLRTFLNTGIAYSGNRALTLDNDRYIATGNIDSLVATFNLGGFNASTDDLRLEFRYKNHGQTADAANKVWIRGSDASPWYQVYDLYANQNPVDGSYKLSSSIELSDSLIAHAQNYTTSFQVKWGQSGRFIAADNDGRSGYTFDDIKLYKVTDDIQVISIDTPYITNCALGSAVPVRVSIRNSANNAVNNIPVILKVDGSVVTTETISSIAANTTIQYTFNPGTANLSTIGDHVVEVIAALSTDTYRTNDTTRVALKNSPVINSFPYLENFESGAGSWYSKGTYNSWEYGTPTSLRINRAASGSKAWKTGLAGFYNDKELSYLYSPCFDLTGMTNPTLSLSLALNIEECTSLCDGAWIEYSNDGVNWIKLGAYGQGYNWYNKSYAGNQLWSEDDTARWRVASIGLPATNNSQLRLRVVFSSDPGVTKEGMAIDDIHIYDNVNGIYDGPTMTAPVTQSIPGGNNWINFLSGGKLVASIKPNNQALGNTAVQAFIHTGPVRNYYGQYYHNRNITVKPDASVLNDSARVRFYFLDNETESLITANGCATCSKPAMAYELGVSKYSNPGDSLEDGDAMNSAGPYWKFIQPAQVSKVPFDRGYYAEFSVKEFSEFWLNDGGPDANQPLPSQLLSFNATKTADNKDVLVSWTMAAELNVDRYEVELAKGYEEFRQNLFTKIGEVDSRGNSSSSEDYSYTDLELNKTGVRYYRLKIVDQNGGYSYSEVRPVVFGDDVKWQVYPNPSPSVFFLQFQAGDGEKIAISIYDASGRAVLKTEAQANGFIQKFPIDLSRFAPGLYLLEASNGAKKEAFRLVRQ